MKSFCLLAAAALFALASCERHEWKETKVLHETHHHDDHEHHEGEAHGHGEEAADHAEAGEGDAAH